MKKWKWWILGVFLLALPMLAFTPPVWVVKSGNQTASATISAVSGYFYGIIVAANAADQVVINGYDSSDSEVSTSANVKIFPQWTVLGGASEKM